MHFFRHYGTVVFEFGPLIFSSTLRYERVHQKLKRSIEGSRNSMNLPMSFAKAYSFNLDEKEADYDKILRKHANYSSLESEFVEYVVQEIKSTCFGGMKFKTNRYYVLQKTSTLNNPPFIRVIKLLRRAGELFIIGRLVDGNGFDIKFYSYIVKNKSDLMRLQPKMLWHYEPLIHFLDYSAKNILMF